MDPLLSPAELQREDAALQRYVHALGSRAADERDVVQETWIAALEADASRVWRNPQGWLRVVARRIVRRERVRRALRSRSEQAAALRALERSGQRPAGPDEALEREAALQALTRLEEPYRSALRMRFFEECSVDEIARQLSRPAATVRSQLHRGLELIRARMSPRQRAERRWAWLAWLARTQAPAAGALVALVGAGALGWRVLVGRSPAPGGPQVFAADPLASAGDEPATLILPASEVRREPARDAAELATTSALSGSGAPETGLLELEITQESGEPVPGALVRVAGPAGFEPAGTSDAAGRARIELYAEDAGALGIPATAGRVSLRASADGYAASPALHVPWPGPEGFGDLGPLRLPLGGPELVLRGQVVDSGGTPVAGARLACGGSLFFQAPPVEGAFLTPLFSEVVSDAGGRFELRHLERLALQLIVFAPGFAEQCLPLAPRAGDALLETRVVLSRGGEIAGVVRGPDGLPVPEAVVYAEPVQRPAQWAIGTSGFDPRLAGILSQTTTDGQGRYRLSGIPSGKRRIWARSRRMVASALLDVADEEVASWEPQLELTEGIRLRLLDEHGSPLAGHRIRMRAGPEEDLWVRLLTTDELGRARVFDCPPWPVHADILDERMVELLGTATGLVPAPEPRLLTISPRLHGHGLLRGVLLGAEGAALPALELKRFDPVAGTTVALAVDPATGRFEQELPPGAFLLGVVVGQRAFSLGEHELAPGELRDLGVMRLPATGRLQLLTGVIDLPGEPAPAEYKLYLEHTVRGAPVYHELVLGPWPPPEELELFPGPHWVEVLDQGGRALFRASAEVSSGDAVWLDLP